MKTTATPNQYLAEAQARQLSRDCGYAYLVKTRVGLYLAAIGVIPSETVLIKFENGQEVTTYRRKYFENAVLCGECTGAGCKHCYPRKGIESFWEYNYNHRNEDPIMNGVNYTAAVKELNR
jgi:hypothetical protein